MWSMRAAAGLTSLVLLGALGACSADDEPSGEAQPEPTVVEQYCEAYTDYFQERASLGSQAEDAEVIAAMKQWAVEVEEIDVPEEMTASARAGREQWLELVGRIKDDDTQDDVMGLEQELDEKEMAQVQAFYAFNDDTCPTSGSGR